MTSKGARYIELTNRLAMVPSVQRLQAKNEHEAATLAHAFLDIEEVCHRFKEDLLPQLFQLEESEKMEEILSTIGVLFHEFLYHVRDPLFYRGLLELLEENHNADAE